MDRLKEHSNSIRVDLLREILNEIEAVHGLIPNPLS